MPTLLIADDDARLRRLIRTYAELENYTCEEAGDGRSALRIFQATPCDLVILDVMMPGMDGFETLEKLRAIRDVPVIMLTARTEEYDKLMGFPPRRRRLCLQTLQPQGADGPRRGRFKEKQQRTDGNLHDLRRPYHHAGIPHRDPGRE